MMPTTSGEMAYLILAVEFGLLALALGVMLIRRKQAATTALIARETSTPVTPDQRHTALTYLMRDTFQLSEDEAQAVLRDFGRREHAFYSMLLILHLGREGKSIDDVPRELSRAIAPWWRIPSIPAPDDTDFFAEDTLSKSPHVEAKQVLDELLAEYRKAFGAEPNLESASPPALAEQPVGHGDDLLSLDDNIESPAPANSVLKNPLPIAASDANIIALDGDLEPAAIMPTNQVTPSDLDFLMENLATDYPQQSAAA